MVAGRWGYEMVGVNNGGLGGGLYSGVEGGGQRNVRTL